MEKHFVAVGQGMETNDRMPYKDPERKRQWELEHRQQRNVRRRMQRLDARSRHSIAPKPAPDPVSDQKPRGVDLLQLPAGYRCRSVCSAV
jgi:hypothetical protein